MNRKYISIITIKQVAEQLLSALHCIHAEHKLVHGYLHLGKSMIIIIFSRLYF